MRKQRNLLLFILAFLLLVASPVARADETSIFTTSHPMPCSPSTSPAAWAGTRREIRASATMGPTICAGPYGTGSVDCRRLSIAKRSMYSLLDDNADGKIDCYDKASLNIRIGYMGFRGPEDTALNPLLGNAMVKWPIGTDYHKMYCNANTGCGSGAYACTTWNFGYGATLAMESAGGGTPLNWALREMKDYLDTHKSADTAKNCRQKFVILLSDGSDTYSCAGTGSDTQADMYKRRRLAVARAKALADAGYRIFVIGFGATMPDYLEKTLNWMAYYGGTDNPRTSISAEIFGYDPTPNAECEDTTTTGTCDGTSTNCSPHLTIPETLRCPVTPLSGTPRSSASPRQATSLIREANYSFTPASSGLGANAGRELHLRGLLPAHQRRSLLAGAPAEIQHQRQRVDRERRLGCRYGAPVDAGGQPDDQDPEGRSAHVLRYDKHDQGRPGRDDGHGAQRHRGFRPGRVREPFHQLLKQGELEAGRHLPLGHGHGGDPVAVLYRQPRHVASPQPERPQCLCQIPQRQRAVNGQWPAGDPGGGQ